MSEHTHAYHHLSELPDQLILNFLAKVNIRSRTNECINWHGDISYDGYGAISARKAGRYYSIGTHRLALMIRKGGFLTRGLVVDHICRNRLCCNARHLELVTNQENIRRGLNGVLRGTK